MLLHIFAGGLAIIGILLLVVDFLSDALETKGWGMFCIIASAALCLLKYYLDNPDPVNNLLKSLTSAK